MGFQTASLASEPLQTWDSGRPTLPWVVETVGLEEINTFQQQRGGIALLEGLLKNQQSSVLFVLGALLIAGLLGSLHALGPGHGKTMMAAYLVGSQGKFYHAIALGLAFTLTHTGTVLLLGLVAFSASRNLLASDLFPIFELASGVMILVLGIGLFIPRFRDWLANHRYQLEIDRKRALLIESESGGKKRLLIQQPIKEMGPAHSHTPSSVGYIPSGAKVKEINWRSLLTLGVSGGLVPCPDAIAILLVALSINRIPFGISLIAMFSLGLATVLIGIGILVVESKRLFQRLRWFDKVSFIMPLVSSVIVLAIGAFLTVKVFRNFTPNFPQLNVPQSVQTSDARGANILYFQLNENSQYQLWTVPLAGGEPDPISPSDKMALDFAVSPRDNTLFYVTSGEENGTRIWQQSFQSGADVMLQDCPDALCANLAVSPDGSRILYNRQEDSSDLTSSGIPSIWWLDIATRETAPMFQDASLPGYNPQWSPDGEWLTYFSINPQEIKIYHIPSGENLSIPSNTGAQIAWSPDSNSLIVNNIIQVGDQQLPKIFSYHLADQKSTQIDPDLKLDENYPAWSPDGDWIAITRQNWGEDRVALGNQIWLMRPDGSEAHPLTRDAKMYHGKPTWSPDSQYILCDVISIDPDNRFSGISLIDIATGEVSQVVTSGNRAGWLGLP